MSIRSRLILDAVLLAAFLATNDPAPMQLRWHEWTAAGFFAGTLVHLVVSWNWVTRVASSFFKKTRAISAINLVVDIALFVSVVTVTLSGLLISRFVGPAFGAPDQTPFVWHVVHTYSADTTYMLLAAHYVLHVPQLVCILAREPKRGAVRRTRPLPRPTSIASPADPTPRPASMAENPR